MDFNPLTIIKNIFGIADKGMDIAKEYVTDKDKQNELIAELDKLKNYTSYLAELQTKTVPIIDAIHKMSRTGQNVLFMLLIFNLFMLDKIHQEDMWLVALMGGGNGVYQYIKGKGK